MTEPEREYVLGTNDAELERLQFQHEAWREQLVDFVKANGLRAGMTVLDVGCGPGFTSFELAAIVGATGRVIACDESARFVGHLASQIARRSLANIDARNRRIEELDVESQSIDVAYARWVLSWLPNVDVAMAQLARALAPGGLLLLQEYLDWGRLRIVPHNPAVARVVEACMQSFRDAGGTIDIGERLPELAGRHGFELQSFDIVSRSGRPGSPVWRWLGEFLNPYSQLLVQRGVLPQSDQHAFGTEWRALAAKKVVLVAPVMVNAGLRRQ